MYRIGRPGAFGCRKEEICQNYDKVYGDGNWRVIWDVNGYSAELPAALALYEDAYFEYFKQYPDELQWIAEKYANVYDNNPSNVNSGCNYALQEFGGNHYQDIAIRRCLIRNGLWFSGHGLLEIRTMGIGKKWGPGEIPFHMPKLIPKNKIPGWWKPDSIESWYQSTKYLETTTPLELSGGLYFVTSNRGKVISAQIALGNLVSLVQKELDIDEEQKSVEEVAIHKARVAYAVFCRPVICDDSGFVIPEKNGYPGIRVGRELKEKGLDYFVMMAKEKPLDAYWIQVLSYFDDALSEPKLFTSKVEGQLIGEARGDQTKPFLKSKLVSAFIIKGMSKTIAELTEEEYKKAASSSRWQAFSTFLKQRITLLSQSF